MTGMLMIFCTLPALVFFYLGSGRRLGVLLLFAGWGLLVTVFAAWGVFMKHPLLFPLVIAGSLAFTLLAYRRLRGVAPDTGWLLALHSLRLPVEGMLYGLFLEKKVPELMTFRGWNFDILSGITALFLLLLYAIRRRAVSRLLLLVWNSCALFLLAVIVVLAVLSAPTPVQRLAFDQPNVAVLQAPYCLLPAVVVPLVALAHLMALRESIND